MPRHLTLWSSQMRSPNVPSESVRCAGNVGARVSSKPEVIPNNSETCRCNWPTSLSGKAAEPRRKGQQQMAEVSPTARPPAISMSAEASCRSILLLRRPWRRPKASHGFVGQPPPGSAISVMAINGVEPHSPPLVTVRPRTRVR